MTFNNDRKQDRSCVTDMDEITKKNPVSKRIGVAYRIGFLLVHQLSYNAKLQ